MVSEKQTISLYIHFISSKMARNESVLEAGDDLSIAEEMDMVLMQ